MEPQQPEGGHVLPVGPRTGEGFHLGGGGGDGGRRHRDCDPKHRTSSVRGVGEARSARVRSFTCSRSTGISEDSCVCVCVG